MFSLSALVLVVSAFAAEGNLVRGDGFTLELPEGSTPTEYGWQAVRPDGSTWGFYAGYELTDFAAPATTEAWADEISEIISDVTKFERRGDLDVAWVGSGITAQIRVRRSAGPYGPTVYATCTGDLESPELLDACLSLKVTAAPMRLATAQLEGSGWSVTTFDVAPQVTRAEASFISGPTTTYRFEGPKIRSLDSGYVEVRVEDTGKTEYTLDDLKRPTWGTFVEGGESANGFWLLEMTRDSFSVMHQARQDATGKWFVARCQVGGAQHLQLAKDVCASFAPTSVASK